VPGELPWANASHNAASADRCDPLATSEKGYWAIMRNLNRKAVLAGRQRRTGTSAFGRWARREFDDEPSINQITRTIDHHCTVN
jgi:hypothetical protein